MENNQVTPHFIELNITELCNRECSFCPRAHGYPNLNLNMSIETAVRIREQSKGFVDLLHIVGRGEPLLNPDFLNILFVLANDFDIRLMTNGDRLHKHIEQMHEILDLNSSKHKIIISLYDDDKQYKTLKERFKDYSDIIYYKTYDTGQGASDLDFNKKHYIANRAGSLYFATSNKPCYAPINRMFIDWDGSINMCCHDWSEKTVYGNIYEENIIDIYNIIANKYGKELIKGNRSCTKQCSKCDVLDDDILKFVYSNWIEKQTERIKILSQS